MSSEELDIVQMMLIARIQEEIEWLTYMKHSLNKKKAIENQLEECDREIRMLMEAGDE